MGLSISSINAKLGVDSSPARLEMQSQAARLVFQRTDAKLNIQSEPPRVTIDQYECFAEAGLKNNYDFLKDASSRAYQQVMDFIGQTAADGGRLAAIENGGNPIAEIAVRDASPVHEFGMGFIPQSRPKIDVTGSIQIEPVLDSNGATNSITGDYTPGRLDINYITGQLDIYVKQYSSIDIKYEGNSIDTII
jgi:hypothetical protein